MVTQHKHLMVGDESDEEDDMHSVCDGPFVEGRLVPHVELMMEDEQLPFGPAIGEEKTDAQAACTVVDTCHQEVLEPNKETLQEIGRLEEHIDSSQMSGDILEMLVHPSMGLPIDEVQIGAVAASRVVYIGRNPLEEYIYRACDTICTHLSFREKRVNFSLLIDRSK